VQLRLIAAIFLLGMASELQAVTIPTVLVGNAGNAPDAFLWPLNNPTNTLFGGVAYDFRIGTTEVTNAQYIEFLNAKAASDPLALYNPSMGSSILGGIVRSGSPGSYSYAAKSNMADKPVNYVSWYDSIRFANWLNNGQGNGDTETGAYTLLGGTPTPSNGVSITRNMGASWFLPSEDEWYKAAYHQPASQGGPFDDYWTYPTASDTAPISATANAVGDISNPGANVANFGTDADWNGRSGNVTTVGSAGPLSQSFYGTFDQAGNVWEWNEALLRDATSRGLRGDSFSISVETSFSYAGFRMLADPSNEASIHGFRVATVPEPSTYTLAALGVIGLLAARRRSQPMRISANDT
jgi:sulfatase modifying factor 1